MSDSYRFPLIESDHAVDPGRPRPARRQWFLIGVALVTLAVSIGSVTLGGRDRIPDPLASASDIRAFVVATALHPSTTEAGSAGGVLGSWWIHAMDQDPTSGELIGFCLESRDLHLAAERVHVRVDPETDSLEFVLQEAVMVELPKTDASGEVTRHEQLIIGPITFTTDIQPDETAPPVTTPS